MKRLRDEVVAETGWIVLKNRFYIDRYGGERSWGFVERAGRREAVVVVAAACESGELILIRQYRVPMNAAVLEFPAGLVDEGESPETTALRELTEETGYRGRIVRMGPPIASSAGLTNEIVRLAFVEAEESPGGTPDRSESEQIEVIRTAPGKLSDLVDRSIREGCAVDAKVYAYLAGLQAR